jgi:hypothetical protein
LRLLSEAASHALFADFKQRHREEDDEKQEAKGHATNSRHKLKLLPLLHHCIVFFVSFIHQINVQCLFFRYSNDPYYEYNQCYALRTLHLFMEATSLSCS